MHEEPLDPRPKLSGVEVNTWMLGIENAYPPEMPSAPPADWDEPFEDGSEIDAEISYKTLVADTWSYKWLLACLYSRCFLHPSPTDTQSAIGDIVRKELYGLAHLRRVNRHRKTKASTARFLMDWDIIFFLHAQSYDCGEVEAIKAALVVTGDETNAQCCTPLQYMNQVWPLSGEALLNSLKAALQKPNQEHHGELVWPMLHLRFTHTPNRFATRRHQNYGGPHQSDVHRFRPCGDYSRGRRTAVLARLSNALVRPLA